MSSTKRSAYSANATVKLTVAGFILSSVLAITTVSSSLNVRVVSTFALVVFAACVILVYDRGGTLWSFSGMSIVILGIFHLGAMLEVALVGSTTMDYIERFIYRPETPKAILLSCVGLLAFVVGVLFARVLNSRRESRTAAIGSVVEGHRFADRQGVAIVGSVMTVAGTTAWLSFIISQDLSIESAYSDYLAASSAGPLQLIFFVLNIGFVLAVTNYQSVWSRIAIAAFVVFSVTAFPIGLRGEVLFPIAAGAAAIAMQRRMPGLKASLFLVVGLNSVIAIVSQTRADGLGAGTSLRTVSPIAGLTEMGGTLRVVEATVEWHDTSGEPFAGIGSIWAPIRDAFLRFVLRETPLNAALNPDYMSTQVARRVGPVGGSIIGETYHDFGLVGLVAVLLMFGILIGTLEIRARTTGSLPIAAAVTFVFLLLVRNSFAAVPTVTILAVGALLGARFLELAMRSRSPRRAARAR